MRFAFRVDSSPKIGIGHLMRCLTLANGLRAAGHECLFVCRDHVNNSAQHIIENNFPLELMSGDRPKADTWLGVDVELDSTDTLRAIQGKSIDWLIVDHYSIDEVWSRPIRDDLPELKIMVIDDLADRKHDCHLLIDQTYNRQREEYAHLIPSYAKFCGGSEFALIRPEFLQARKHAELSEKGLNKVPHILVTLGGGDIAEPLKVVGEALAELAREKEFSLTAIVGKTNEEALAPLRSLDMDVSLIPFTDNIALEMLKADLAIGAGGGTSWERCCVGLPTIVLTLADNQIEIAKIIEENHAGISIKTQTHAIVDALFHLIDNTILLQTMVFNARKLCDGNGVSRLLNNILEISIEVLPASMDDAQFIFNARYSDGVFQFYRNHQVPSFDDHVSWLETALADECRQLLIFKLGDQAVGHVRLDQMIEDRSKGEIGICLDELWRGKGIGTAILKQAATYFSAQGIRTIEAEIHEDNHGSKVIFERSDYRYVSTDSEGFMRYLWQDN